MFLLDNYKEYDKRTRYIFKGSELAENFTKIVQESLNGLLKYNIRYDGKNKGFVSASIGGRPWTNTMWTRDAGVILRELVEFNYLGTASLIVEQLMKLSIENEEAFISFPEYFILGKPDSGDELDGTAMILLGTAKLYEKLIAGDKYEIEFAEIIYKYLVAKNSPLNYIVYKLSNNIFIEGEGEFGGGLDIDGKWMNVVQNSLVFYAIKTCTEIFKKINLEIFNKLKKIQNNLEKNILEKFTQDGELIWCLNPKSLSISKEVINANVAVGFSGINGACAMSSDAFGFDIDKWMMKPYFSKTFYGLLENQKRNYYYNKCGIYLQFEKYCKGMLTSPSYGQGYAIQSALLLNDIECASNLIKFLVSYTVNPQKDYTLSRKNKYWVYERMFVDDYFKLPKDEQDIDEGCGALNAVNIGETLKCARLIAGIYNTANGYEIKPRLVQGIENCIVENFFIKTSNGYEKKTFLIKN